MNDYKRGQVDLIASLRNTLIGVDLSLEAIIALVELEPLEEPASKYVYTNGTNMGKNDFDREQEAKKVRPARYSAVEVDGKDVIDLVKHWNLNFNEGNILKYLLRKKDQDISDMNKIEVFAGREKEYLKIIKNK